MEEENANVSVDVDFLRDVLLDVPDSATAPSRMSGLVDAR
jgi:hypothetical protein